MKRVLSLKRLLLYGGALLICVFLWKHRFRVESVVWNWTRPRHVAMNAGEWWSLARGQEGLRAALPFVADVVPEDVPRLLHEAASLPSDQQTAILWYLAAAGRKEAVAALHDGIDEGRGAEMASHMPWIDLAGLCREVRSPSPAGLQLRRLAARLLLASREDAGGDCPHGGGQPPSVDALEVALWRALLGRLPRDCSRRLVQAADEEWPRASRAMLRRVMAWLGPDGVSRLADEVLVSTEEEVRTGAAMALICGPGSPSWREATAKELERRAGERTDSVDDLVTWTVKQLRWRARS